MAILSQSTAYTRKFLMVLSSDHITGATGLSPVVSLAKATATTFTTATGTVVEVSGGWYQIPLATTDTNTLGELAFHATTTATTADPTDWCDQVAVLQTNVVQWATGTVATPNTTGVPKADFVSVNGVTSTATNGLPFVSLTATGIDSLFTKQLTESYAADGSSGTVAQFLHAIQQFQQEKQFSATMMVVKGLDGTTTKMTFNVDSAATPQTITRTL